MSSLAAADRAQLAELDAALHTWDARAPSILAVVLPAVAELLRADKACAYRVDVDDEGARVGFLHAYGFDAPRMRRATSEWFASRSDGAVAYNLAVPERWQRNVAIDMFRLIRDGRHPMRDELFPKVGLAGHHQMRALVCDGPSLLTWVGGLRLAPFGRRERLALDALVPALQRRLRLERQLGEAQLGAFALDAALDALGVPAYIVSSAGALRHANAAGRAAMAARPVATRRALAAPDDRYQVTPLLVPGLPEHRLVVERRPRDEVAPRVAAAARRWGLTARQAEVLALVARGAANKTIAAALRCTARTVELHVSAILARADVDSRAALVARLWSDP